MAALLMFETAVFQVASFQTGHSPVVGPSECKLGLSVFRAHLFPPATQGHTWAVHQTCDSL